MELFREARPKRGKRSHFGLEVERANEVTFNSTQALAVKELVGHNCIARACVEIFVSHTLAGGISVLQNGEEVPVNEWATDGPAAQTLQAHWIAFAKDVVREALISGVVVSVVDEAESPSASGFRTQRKIPAPYVVGHDNVEVKRTLGGRSGLKPVFLAYDKTRLTSTLKPAEDLFVHCFSPPDQNGNVSAVATAAVEDMAMTETISACEAAVSRANCRPKLSTQHRRPAATGPFTDGSLFFDSESRALQSQDQESTARQEATVLALQARLVKEINTAQQIQSNQQPNDRPPPPSNFDVETVSVPRDFEASSAYHHAQGRTDFVSVIGQRDSRICTAFGVPSSLILPDARMNVSQQQSTVFTKTCTALAEFVSRVLTEVYRSTTTSGPIVDLVVRASPVHAAAEIINGFSAGLLPRRAAVVMLMGSSFGANKNEIDQVLLELEAEAEARPTREADEAAKEKADDGGDDADDDGDAPQSEAGGR